MESGDTENKASMWVRGMEGGQEGMGPGRLVVPSVRSGIRFTLLALEVSGYLMSLKYTCLKCNYKAEKIQSGIRKAWAWSIGWGWGHLGQWEPPYSCAVETYRIGQSLTHVCIPSSPPPQALLTYPAGACPGEVPRGLQRGQVQPPSFISQTYRLWVLT